MKTKDPEKTREQIKAGADERTSPGGSDASKEDLRRKASELDAFFKAFPVICFRIATDGKILDYRASDESLLYLPPEDFLGRRMQDVLPPGVARKFEEAIEELRRTGSGVRIEYSLSVPQGEQIFEAKLVALLGEEIFVLVRDITGEKRVQEELRQAKEAAETADRAKREFLAHMGHEIRTPLTAMIGMAELALRTKLSAEQQEYLDVVRGSADSLSTLVGDLVDFSRIEAGKLGLESVEFDARDSLAAVVRQLAPRAEARGLELICRVRPGVPDHLLGDPARLRQILANLVGNAIKFTEQGEVDIRVEMESETDEEVRLHFRVIDTGVGILPEEQKLIFESFTQASAPVSGEERGVGLGLAIVSKLVGMMDGRLWVESEVNRGSTFHFTARFHRPAPEPLPISAPKAAGLEGLRVLMMESHASTREALGEILSDHRMKAVAVSGPEEALVLVQKRAKAGDHFDIALIEAGLGEADGFEFSERLLAEPVFEGKVILMAPPSARRRYAARSDATGTPTCVMKPVLEKELLPVLQEASGVGPAIPEAGKRRTPGDLRKSRKRLRVLVAEDNLDNQRLVARMLEKRGHTAVLVRDGRQVMAVIERETFDVVLMDVQMPDMDGLEACALVRQREKETGGHVPIIALTAYAMKGDQDRCLEAGMDGYLAKPIRIKDLFNTIEAVVGTRVR